MLPFVNQHQVYPKVHLYIPILTIENFFFFRRYFSILDTEDDQMYIVLIENHIIFHASIRKKIKLSKKKKNYLFFTFISFRCSRIVFCSKSLFKSFATNAKPFVLSRLL